LNKGSGKEEKNTDFSILLIRVEDSKELTISGGGVEGFIGIMNPVWDNGRKS